MDRDNQRKAGLAVAHALVAMKLAIDEGARNTLEIDRIGHQTLLKYGAKPSCLGYKPAFHYEPYKFATCLSVNDEIVHGVPSATKILVEGDVVGLDVVGEYDGWHADAAITVSVGKISSQAHKLLRVAHQALDKGIAAALPGATTGDIGWTIMQYARKNGMGIADDLSGHGIGQSIHCEPSIPNRGFPKTGTRLTPGMSISVEPMLNLGTDKVARSLDNDWAIVTRDGSISAHFEHTVLIGENATEILTPWHEML